MTARVRNYTVSRCYKARVITRTHALSSWVFEIREYLGRKAIFFLLEGMPHSKNDRRRLFSNVEMYRGLPFVRTNNFLEYSRSIVTVEFLSPKSYSMELYVSRGQICL